MEENLQKVINAAKYFVHQKNREQIDWEAILGALFLLKDDPAIHATLQLALGAQEPVWPTELADALAVVSPDASWDPAQFSFELEGNFKATFNALKKRDSSLPLLPLLQAAFLPENAQHSSALSQFLHANCPPTKGLLSRLLQQTQQRLRLEKILSDEVIGQADAIRMLGHGYLRALRSPAEKGLRGIFTFMGPPGVGKTMLAEKFAKALSSVESGKNQPPFELLKFSMESILGEGFRMKIFGSDSHYGNTKPGVLYQKVSKNPRQVILFDEIEKADPGTLQSLLTLLNSGEIEDHSVGQKVPLNQCFVILTTNLGQDFFSARKRSGILRGGDFSSDELFDMLASAKRREHQKVDFAPTVFSPEFVNRLRKGQAVLFNQFRGSDYEKLLVKSFSSMAEKQTTELHRIDLEGQAHKFLTLSLLPDISPRKVASEAANFRELWLDQLVKAPPENLLQENPESFRLAVRDQLSGEAQAAFTKALSAQSLRIVTIDDDERFQGYLDKALLEIFQNRICSIERFGTVSAAESWLESNQPDMIFLDLDLPEFADKSSGILTTHRSLHEKAKESALVLFSEQRGKWHTTLTSMAHQGGAADFLEFSKLSDNPVLDEDQNLRFREILQNALFEKWMSHLGKTSKQLKLETSFSYEPTNNTLFLNVEEIKLTHVPSTAGNPGGFQPAPIPATTMEDVFGLERAKERLLDAIQWMKNPHHLAAFRVPPPSGFLLAGPSGTGKTHLARATANAAGGSFYSLSAGELESKWVGEGEERIRQLFDAALRNAPAVIFIDEIDAIARRRGGEQTGGDHYTSKLLNQLLTCMDGFAENKGQILVLAATNLPEALDPAILRPGRFDEIIRIEVPTAKAREAMFARRLRAMKAADDVFGAIPRLVCRTAGLSPAEVDRVLREAAYAAAKAGRKQILLSDLENAASFVRYGASRADMPVNENERQRTAWHEAGHAVAMIKLCQGKLDFLSIVPNEAGALGFAAWQHEETRQSFSADDFRNRIVVSLAGREAEKLCPNGGSAAINTGVSSDYQRATQLAWEGITKYGFDEAFGAFSLAGVPGHLQAHLGDSIKTRVDAWLANCLQQTRDFLAANQTKVEALAQALLEKEALDGAEVEALLTAQS